MTSFIHKKSEIESHKVIIVNEKLISSKAGTLQYSLTHVMSLVSFNTPWKCFQWVLKETSGMEWVKIDLLKMLEYHNENIHVGVQRQLVAVWKRTVMIDVLLKIIRNFQGSQYVEHFWTTTSESRACYHTYYSEITNQDNRSKLDWKYTPKYIFSLVLPNELLAIFLFQRWDQEKQVGQHFISCISFYFWTIILCGCIECMLQTIWPQMKLLEELVKFYVFFQSPKVYVKKIIYCNVT